jgi:hypothetical protein
MKAAFDAVADVCIETLEAGGDRDVFCRWEAVPGTLFIRVYVVSRLFRNMPIYERQNFVWQLAYQHVGRELVQLVATLAALTPEEYAALPD